MDMIVLKISDLAEYLRQLGPIVDCIQTEVWQEGDTSDETLAPHGALTVLLMELSASGMSVPEFAKASGSELFLSNLPRPSIPRNILESHATKWVKAGAKNKEAENQILDSFKRISHGGTIGSWIRSTVLGSNEKGLSPDVCPPALPPDFTSLLVWIDPDSDQTPIAEIESWIQEVLMSTKQFRDVVGWQFVLAEKATMDIYSDSLLGHIFIHSPRSIHNERSVRLAASGLLTRAGADRLDQHSQVLTISEIKSIIKVLPTHIAGCTSIEVIGGTTTVATTGPARVLITCTGTCAAMLLINVYKVASSSSVSSENLAISDHKQAQLMAICVGPSAPTVLTDVIIVDGGIAVYATSPTIDGAPCSSGGVLKDLSTMFEPDGTGFVNPTPIHATLRKLFAPDGIIAQLMQNTFDRTTAKAWWTFEGLVDEIVTANTQGVLAACRDLRGDWPNAERDDIGCVCPNALSSPGSILIDDDGTPHITNFQNSTRVGIMTSPAQVMFNIIFRCCGINTDEQLTEAMSLISSLFPKVLPGRSLSISTLPDFRPTKSSRLNIGASAVLHIWSYLGTIIAHCGYVHGDGHPRHLYMAMLFICQHELAAGAQNGHNTPTTNWLEWTCNHLLSVLREWRSRASAITSGLRKWKNIAQAKLQKKDLSPEGVGLRRVEKSWLRWQHADTIPVLPGVMDASCNELRNTRLVHHRNSIAEEGSFKLITPNRTQQMGALQCFEPEHAAKFKRVRVVGKGTGTLRYFGPQTGAGLCCGVEMDVATLPFRKATEEIRRKMGPSLDQRYQADCKVAALKLRSVSYAISEALKKIGKSARVPDIEKFIEPYNKSKLDNSEERQARLVAGWSGLHLDKTKSSLEQLQLLVDSGEIVEMDPYNLLDLKDVVRRMTEGNDDLDSALSSVSTALSCIDELRRELNDGKATEVMPQNYFSCDLLRGIIVYESEVTMLMELPQKGDDVKATLAGGPEYFGAKEVFGVVRFVGKRRGISDARWGKYTKWYGVDVAQEHFPHPCFHGEVNGSKTEAILRDGGSSTGKFLIRGSNPLNWTVSVIVNNEIKGYPLTRTSIEGEFSFDGTPTGCTTITGVLEKLKDKLVTGVKAATAFGLAVGGSIDGEKYFTSTENSHPFMIHESSIEFKSSDIVPHQCYPVGTRVAVARRPMLAEHAAVLLCKKPIAEICLSDPSGTRTTAIVSATSEGRSRGWKEIGITWMATESNSGLLVVSDTGKLLTDLSGKSIDPTGRYVVSVNGIPTQGQTRTCTVVGVLQNGNYEVRFDSGVKGEFRASLGDHYLAETPKFDIRTKVQHFSEKYKWQECEIDEHKGEPSGSRYTLLMDNNGASIREDFDLSTMNCFTGKMSKDRYESAVEAYFKKLQTKETKVMDNITGHEMNIKDQLVKIGIRHEASNTGDIECPAVGLWGEKVDPDAVLYFTTLDEATTTALLKGQNLEGSFLIRLSADTLAKSVNSGRAANEFILSAIFGGVVVSARLLRGGEDEPLYMHHLSGSNDHGAPTNLGSQFLEDAVSYLRKEAQAPMLGKLGGVGLRPNGWQGVGDAIALCRRMTVPCKTRSDGIHTAERVLISAEAGSGKTWMTKQLLAVASSIGEDNGRNFLWKTPISERYVPFLVVVQRLATLMKKDAAKGAEKSRSSSTYSVP